MTNKTSKTNIFRVFVPKNKTIVHKVTLMMITVMVMRLVIINLSQQAPGVTVCVLSAIAERAVKSLLGEKVSIQDPQYKTLQTA